jgi:hypothetical protein
VHYKALLVCNSRYTADPDALPNLRGPRSDGDLLAAALVHKETGIFSAAGVRLLHNVTSGQMQEEINIFFQQGDPDDVLLFYFSGHGFSKYQKLYFCATNTNSALLPGTALSNDVLNTIIDDSGAAAKVLILDCCHSGAFKGNAIAERLSGTGRFVLTATPPTQLARDAEVDGEPSPFTAALVAGLTGGAQGDPNGQVSLESLYTYLRNTLVAGPEPGRNFHGHGSIAIAQRLTPTTVTTLVDSAPPVAGSVSGAQTEPLHLPTNQHPVPFLEVITTATTASADRVAAFRADLRDDVAQDMPRQLSASEFLHRAHLMVAGQLTRAGALLFGDDPTAVVRTAMVQCTQVHGSGKDSPMSKRDLRGTIPEQIVQARNFVGELAKRGETPTEDDAVTQPVYEFPMIAVREIIANALVHRDYEHPGDCVHVRMFTDRLEVINPGTWVGGNLPDGETRPLSDLQTESHRRNFHLASVLTWMKIVEGEGSGIPRAISDCQRVGAPEPTVKQLGDKLIVTIYPRVPPEENVVDPAAVRMAEIRQLVSVFDEIPSMADATTRQSVVDLLPPELAATMPRHPTRRVDVENIVTRAYDAKGGVDLLLRAAQLVDGGTSVLVRPETVSAAGIRGGTEPPKVYVSGTQTDLRVCRAAVHRAIRRLGLEDFAVAGYVADDRSPLEKCLESVAQCDVYLGLFAWRYSYIAEAEYREAVRLGKPCLVSLLAPDAPWPRDLIDRGPDGERILKLREELVEKHICGFFTGPDDLAAMVSAALTDYQAGRQQRPIFITRPGGELSDEVRHAYHERLNRHYRRVELDALTPEPSVDSLSVALTAIFVEPTAREDLPPELPRGSPEWTAYGEAKPSQPVLDIIAQPEHPAIVLLGNPGAGKSTLTSHLALTLAGFHEEPRLASLSGYLPVLVEVRSYLAHLGDRRCENFLDYLDHRYDTGLPGIKEDVLLPYLRSGGTALFLFDGLDEIFEPARREEVISQIAAFRAEFPGVRVLVTSRIIGYSRGRLADAGFAHFTIDDFGDAQIDQFLRAWCPLVLSGQPTAAESRRQRILDAIRVSPAIRELAGNPLLLTILAIIGRDRALPRERWRLYEHAANVLIAQWNVDRQAGQRRTEVESMDLFAKKELLRRLAYQMQFGTDGANYIELRQLLRVFEDYLVERFQTGREKASAMAQSMIEQLHERNFILGRYGPGQYGFVHRTFLEFFCAEAIVEMFQQGDPDMSTDRLRDLFRRHWADPSWREVLRLVVGRLPDEHADALITLLTVEVNTPWPVEEFSEPPWNIALAAQCVAEVPDPAAVATAAQILLRRLILLIEHGVSIVDRNTVELTEAEILPAIRVVGTRWPGRQLYLHWYHRRGVRVSWAAGSSFATRVAVMLATAHQDIEDLLNTELGSTDDRRARHALVAGLAESAGLANQPAQRTSVQRRARCRALLVQLVQHDSHGAIRMAALRALVTQFGSDPQTAGLLSERATTDAFGGVRLLAVESLTGLDMTSVALRALLLDRAGNDPHDPVRRAAVAALGRLWGDEEISRMLLDRVRHDHDPGVLQVAFRALVARSDTSSRPRALLVARLRDPDDLVRRTAVRLLSESFTDVRDLLVAQVSGDPDPRTRDIALRELIRTSDPDPGLRELLVDRIERDEDGALRLDAVGVLVERFPTDPALRTVLSRLAYQDPDARVRQAAVQELARLFDHASTIEVLIDRAASDSVAWVRLAATQALADHFGADPRTRAVLITQTDEERDTIVRLATVRTLIRMGADPRIHKTLFSRIAQDPDPQIIREATGELVAFTGWRDRVAELLAERAVRDTYARVRLAAVDLLLSSFGDRIPETALLLDRAEKDPDPTVFDFAVTALVRRSAEAVPVRRLLVERAADVDAVIRLVAVELLGAHFSTDPGTPELLLATARADPDIQVRRAAVGRLGAGLAHRPEVREALVEFIDDYDWSIRRTVLHALGQHFGFDEEIRSLIIDRARNDPSTEFRRLAGQTLSWLPGADPDDLPDA